MEGKGNGRLTFLLTAGDHELEVRTASGMGYYSGIYFPPALGTPEKLDRINAVQGFAYAAAFLVPLVLTVFTFFVWHTGGGLGCWFGELCGCYALYMLRYFVFLFSMPVVPHCFFTKPLTVRTLSLPGMPYRRGIGGCARDATEAVPLFLPCWGFA